MGRIGRKVETAFHFPVVPVFSYENWEVSENHTVLLSIINKHLLLKVV